MLTIKNVSQITGVSEYTLRAWEKRYGAVVPQRSDGGRRDYSLAEAKRVKVLADLIAQGYSIGNIAKLKTEELSKIWKERSGETLDPLLNYKSEFDVNQNNFCVSSSSIMDSVLENLLFYRISDIMHQIRMARQQMDARMFLLDFVAPLLGKVGRLVAEEAKYNVSHEHALSAVLKFFLGEMLYSLAGVNSSHLASQDKVTLVFATSENDYHEFGIQISACLAAIMGFKVFYVGPNIPSESLVACAASLGNSTILVLGVLIYNRTAVKKKLDYIAQCQALLKAKTPIWVGGNLSDWCSEAQLNALSRKGNINFISNFEEYELMLMSLEDNSTSAQNSVLS